MGQISTQYKKEYATEVISNLPYIIGRINDYIKPDDFEELELLITSLIKRIEYPVIKKLDQVVIKLLEKHNIIIREDTNISMYKTYALDNEVLLRILQMSLTYITHNTY